MRSSGYDRHRGIRDPSELGSVPSVSIAAAAEAMTAAYRSRFDRWEERASVRAGPRRVLDGDEGDVRYFPPELVPMVAHPLVTELGPAAVERILVHRLHQYLSFTVELEQNAVVPVTTVISRGRSGLTLPEGMRADAFKIATDEAWHAQFSYDLTSQVIAATGVPDRTPEPGFLRRLEVVRDAQDVDLRLAADLVSAVVSETLISAILADLPRDKRLPRAVREVVADHAEDEGRHHAYFKNLIDYLWPALGPRRARQLGVHVPELIYAFLEPDQVALGHALAEVGLGQGAIEQVLHEVHPRDAVRAAAAAAARPTVRYFRQAGALDDPEVEDAFRAAGLLPGS